MNYLYHWVPKNMTGNILYPLNILKKTHPEIYEAHAKKYVGRPELLELSIPSLNCLWNDVLHLSAIHPKEMKDAMLEAGLKRQIKISCYQIDPHLLEPEKTIIYLYDQTPSIDMTLEKNFTKYDPDNLEQYSNLPQETKDYYVESFAAGENPLAMHKAVHILYRGSIDISNSPIIEV